MYKVISTFPIKSNTAVSVQGNGIGIKNDCYIRNDKGILFHVLSVAMENNHETPFEETEILVEGLFTGDYFKVESSS